MVIFYSEKYDKRTKAKRAATIAKAQELIANPEKYTQATSYGASGYIKNIEFDKETGEFLESSKKLSLDLEKLEEEEKYDGYYVIVTSEYKESDNRIIEMYIGEKLEIDFSKKILSLGEIKNILGQVKI